MVIRLLYSAAYCVRQYDGVISLVRTCRCSGSSDSASLAMIKTGRFGSLIKSQDDMNEGDVELSWRDFLCQLLDVLN